MMAPPSSSESIAKSDKWTGELHRFLCMQGGDHDGSYAKNSEVPASAITLCKPMLLAAIQSMQLFAGAGEGGGDSFSVRVADLGCATGYNTLATIEMVVESLRERYIRELGVEPEFEAFFSDLPSNDFNSLFRSLSVIECNDKRPRRYFVAGVPGSFYRRLFPEGKLHVAVSLSALHWLSQIPVEVLDKGSRAWNKGRAWIDGANEEVASAYARQSEEDLDNFLKCRKEEILAGGILFMLMGGRPNSQEPSNQLGDEAEAKTKHPFTSSMDQAWQDLLNEGLIDEETRDCFNIPAYMRSMEEVERAIARCGGFEIQRMEYKRISEHSDQKKQEELIMDPVSYGRVKANLVRATLGPIVEAHIGAQLSEQLFQRLERRVSSDISLIRKTCFYGVIIICAIRK